MSVDPVKELLRALNETAEFKIIMAQILKERPIVPEYRPQDTQDETHNLVERIKYESAQRTQFDRLYRRLTGVAPE